jgi:hypothetical protein
MPRFRYDKELDCLVEIRDGANFFDETKGRKGPAIITDDLGAGVNGLRHMATGKYLDSKSAFRAATKAAGCVETGNETPRVYDDRPTQRQMQHDRVGSIKRAMGEYGSNTRDRR